MLSRQSLLCALNYIKVCASPKSHKRFYLRLALLGVCGICVIIKLTNEVSYNEANFVLPSHLISQNPQAPDSIVVDSIESKIHSSNIPNIEKMAHSSSIVDLDSKIMVVYFAGSKEGARDVKIYQSFLEKDTLDWSEPKAILTPSDLSRLSQKFIRKLGNPVVFRDSKNRVHLFVVGVSLGGWTTSKIYQFYFDDLWNLNYVGELHLGAFVNFSHLVRTPAVMLENGGFMLPFYHELADKYALVAFFDEGGGLSFVKRLNMLKKQLQPSIIPISNAQCLGISRVSRMRYDRVMHLQQCDDKGNVWYPPYKSNLKNYDSSSVLISVNNEILLLHNDGLNNPEFSLDKPRARSALSLFWLVDKDSGEFRYLTTIDSSQTGDVSYPNVVVDSNFIHITYTFGSDKSNIKYARLNLKWIEALIRKEKMQKDRMEIIPLAHNPHFAEIKAN